MKNAALLTESGQSSQLGKKFRSPVARLRTTHSERTYQRSGTVAWRVLRDHLTSVGSKVLLLACCKNKVCTRTHSFSDRNSHLMTDLSFPMLQRTMNSRVLYCVSTTFNGDQTLMDLRSKRGYGREKVVGRERSSMIFSEPIDHCVAVEIIRKPCQLVSMR